MRLTILLLLLSLGPCIAEAVSYNPKGYIADTTAYYPSIPSPDDIGEIVEISHVYGLLPKSAQIQATKRMDEILSQQLPLEFRAQLLVARTYSDAKKLRGLPKDVLESIYGTHNKYMSLPERAKITVAMYIITGDKSFLSGDVLPAAQAGQTSPISKSTNG